MEIEKTFLETFKEVFDKLKQDGIVKQEEIEEGFGIPMVWLTSSGIQRDALIGALRNIYEREHYNSRYKLNRFKRFADLRYSEKDGVPYLQVFAGKNSILITDEPMETEKWVANVTAKDVIIETVNFKKRLKTYELENEFNIPKEVAVKMADRIFDSKQIESDLYATPNFLNEMALNFGDYYRMLQEEKQKIDEINAAEQEMLDRPIETRGGIVEQAPDLLETPRAPKSGEKTERVSDIYTFEQRDEIFRSLKPKRIIKYDGLDRNRQIVKDAYTLYLYKNPQKHKGYLGVSEPFNGDKEARAFFITEEMAEGLQENENLDEFWHTIGEVYIGMQRSEFSKAKGTYTFKHTGDLEAYKQKIEGVIAGIEDNSQSTNSRRASLRLFGKINYKDMIDGVTRSGYEEAKEAIFGDREINQTKEGEERNG